MEEEREKVALSHGLRNYEIEAVSRAMRVLGIMMEQPVWHTLGQLSRSTGLSRNAVFRILKTFEMREVAVQEEKRWLLSSEFEKQCRQVITQQRGGLRG